MNSTHRPREEWRPIPFAPGYHISNRGRVRSPRKVLKPWDDGRGYLRVSISGQKHKVHMLVAGAFLPDCPEPGVYIVDHVDGKKHHNHANNLEWVTLAENLRRAWRGGLKKPVPPGKGKPGNRNNKKSRGGQRKMHDPTQYPIASTGKGVPFERIRRITGYLVGTMDKWSDAKRAEEAERVKHGMENITNSEVRK